MNGNVGAAQSQPSHIGKLEDNLDKAVDDLDTAVDVLIQKIGRALGPERADKVLSTGQPDVPHSGLGNHLSSVIDQLEDLAIKVRAATDRVEL